MAVLTAASISGRESNVLHVAANRVPREFISRTRALRRDEWRANEQRLSARGLLGDDGSLTEAGRTLKEQVESSTDALAVSALDALSDDEVEALFQAFTPITRAVVAGGDVAAVTRCRCAAKNYTTAVHIWPPDNPA